MSGKRIIRAPRGSQRTCKDWHQEAAMRMLMNNLDPDVAENPDQLVVYGGTGRAVHDQLIWILRYVWVEIVHQHPHCGFLMPVFAGALAAAWRADDSFSAHDFSSSPSKSPRRIASATRAMSPESARSCVSGGAISRTTANACSTPAPAFNGLRCCKPSAAVSSSIASKFSARSTIDRSFSALVIPIET